MHFLENSAYIYGYDTVVPVCPSVKKNHTTSTKKNIQLQQKTIQLQQKTIQLQQKTIQLQQKNHSTSTKTIQLQQELFNSNKSFNFSKNIVNINEMKIKTKNKFYNHFIKEVFNSRF